MIGAREPAALRKMGIAVRSASFILLILCGAVSVSLGQTNFPVTITRSAGNVLVGWQVQSVVPQGGALIFADYDLERTADFREWELVQSYRSNSVARKLTRSIPLSSAESGFFRIRTRLDLSGRQLVGANLRRGNFKGIRFLGADLFRASLIEANLDEADLAGADLRQANFQDATLTRANLFAASMADAVLRGADLRGADLSFADASRADLSSADLSFADLRFTLLTDADLNFAFLRGVQLDERTDIARKWRTVAAILNRGISGLNLRSNDLSFATLIGADLRGADLRNADLRGSDFRLVNLSGADLMGANLHLAELRFSLMDDTTRVTNKWCTVWRLLNDPDYPRDLTRLNLTNVALRGASWTNVNFGSANLTASSLFETTARDCTFTNVILNDFDLEACGLGGSDLTRAQVRRAQGNRMKLEGAVAGLANFEAASLTNASFAGANLTGAIFRNCNLSRANFTGAFLTNVTFQNATMTGVNFRDARFSNTVMQDGKIRNE